MRIIVGFVLAITNLINAYTLIFHQERSVFDLNRGLDEFRNESLVGRFTGKIFTIHGQESFLTIRVDTDTRHYIAIALNRRVRHSEHVSQKTPGFTTAVCFFAKLYTGPGRCRLGCFEQAIHRA
jgi:hypothetical protein